MGLRYILGSSGAGKSYQAYQNIIQQSMKYPNQFFYIIVPDQFTMQTQKELVNMHPHKGIMNIDVLSFVRLAHRIFDDRTMGRTILDDTGKSLILRLLASKNREKLGTIGGNLDKIGYIHEVKSAISEFMQYGIHEEMLSRMIAECEDRRSLKHKLSDLSLLYSEFKQYIQDKFITTEETLSVLADMIPYADILKNSVILLDQFTGFTPVQMQVIEQMMAVAAEVQVALVIRQDTDAFNVGEENDLFYLTQKTIQRLNEIADNNHTVREKDVILTNPMVFRLKNNKEMSHLEQQLFQAVPQKWETDQLSISISEYQSPKDEIRAVSGEIIKLTREEGLCYRDIAVVAGDLAGYAHFVEEEFTKLEIPFFLDQTRGIVMNPFTEYIRSGLQVALKNFQYDSVFHMLRSGFSNLTEDEIDKLDNYVIALGIKGRNRYQKLFTIHTKETNKSGEYLEWLNQARTKFVQSVEPLLSECKTAGEWVKATYQFIELAGAEEKLLNYAHLFHEAADFVKEKEYEQIYRLVMELLEQIYTLLRDEPMTLKEYSQILDAGLGEIQVGTIPQSIDRVVVGDIERTRLKEIKVLLFIGVNDGYIPQNTQKGGIISDVDREILVQSGWEMAPSPRQKMYIQRLYLYMNMTKPSEQLRISYTRMDKDSKTIRPSYLIRSLCNIFPKLQVIKERDSHTLQIPYTEGEAKELLSQNLRDYAMGAFSDNKEKKEAFLNLYSVLRKKDELGVIDRLVEQAFIEKNSSDKVTELGREIAALVYGTVLDNSVSRLEKYAACAYSHFLQYGLELREREEYTFESKDLGTIYHAVLQYFSEGLSKNNYTWLNFPEEFGKNLLEEAIHATTADYQASILYTSKRNEYIIDRLKRILLRTVMNLKYQAGKGAFTPKEFELSFSRLDDLDAVNIKLSNEERMYLRGRIDRIDTCEQEDKILVKVIDYKSGKKDFDLLAVYHGLSLQLVVYMNAAMQYESKKNPDKKIVPAALLYYQVEDPFVDGSGKSEEDIEKLLKAQLAMTGVINSEENIFQKMDNDPGSKSDVIPISFDTKGNLKASSSVMSTEQFDIVSQYVDKKIRAIGTRIMQGDIDRNPYKLGKTDACTYCAYKAACGYDEKLPGYEKRSPEEMTPMQCLNRMEEELQ